MAMALRVTLRFMTGAKPIASILLRLWVSIPHHPPSGLTEKVSAGRGGRSITFLPAGPQGFPGPCYVEPGTRRKYVIDAALESPWHLVILPVVAGVGRGKRVRRDPEEGEAHMRTFASPAPPSLLRTATGPSAGGLAVDGLTSSQL